MIDFGTLRASAGTRRTYELLDMRFVDVLWLIAFNLVLFSSCIDTLTGFSYTDEIITCIAAAATAYRLFKDVVRRTLVASIPVLVAVLSLVLFVGLGLYSNVMWGIQEHLRAIVIDVFACIKFPLLLICALYLFHDAADDLLHFVELEVKAIVVVLLSLAVVNLFVNIGMSTEPRYGLRPFMFLCGHPTGLVAMTVSLVLILLRDADRNRPWIAAAPLVIAASLRSKGFVFCALTIIMMIVLRQGRTLKPVHIALCVIAALAIGWDQYVSYFQTEGYARTEITRASIEIATDYLPLGPGFATFGSNITGAMPYYTSLYYTYELADVIGLMEGEADFLSDTFWPTVLGQFGWAGLALFVTFTAALFKMVYDAAGTRRIIPICCFAYLIISSTSESAFFHPMAVSLAFTLGLAVGGRRPSTVEDGKSQAGDADGA